MKALPARNVVNMANAREGQSFTAAWRFYSADGGTAADVSRLSNIEKVPWK